MFGDNSWGGARGGCEEDFGFQRSGKNSWSKEFSTKPGINALIPVAFGEYII
jgi:hypothetical protein